MSKAKQFWKMWFGYYKKTILLSDFTNSLSLSYSEQMKWYPFGIEIDMISKENDKSNDNKKSVF